MIVVAVAVAEELGEFHGRAGAIDVLVTGVGPVEAAAAVAARLARGDVDLLINAGIAGAFGGVADVGEAVCVAEEFMEVGLETGERITLPGGAKVRERVAASARFIDPLVAMGFPAVTGITVSRVTATDETAIRLAALGAQVETMEGYAALRAAALANVPAIELRGISNIVGDRGASRWNFHAGTSALTRILTDFLRVVMP